MLEKEERILDILLAPLKRSNLCFNNQTFTTYPTRVLGKFQGKREKQCCSSSHKQYKTLFKDHMVRLKTISLYIYKDLRLKTKDLKSNE